MKKAVITYILDGYDRLKDPAVVTPGWDYLCFSDDDFGSEIWKPLPLPPSPFGTICPKRRTSLLKIQHFDYVSEDYDLVMTLDGSMTINCNLDAFLDEFWTDQTDLLIARHFERNCLYAEAKAVLVLPQTE